MTGFRCPQCKTIASEILDSRPMRFWRWRRHRCMACDRKFSTVELLFTRQLREALWRTKPPKASS